MNSQEILQVVHEKDPWIVEENVEKSSWYVTNDDEDIVVEINGTKKIDDDDQVIVLDNNCKKNRRKSWHAIKFERKRKKGIIENNTPNEHVVRQKRPSWWNIFGQQQWPRYFQKLTTYKSYRIMIDLRVRMMDFNTCFFYN